MNTTSVTTASPVDIARRLYAANRAGDLATSATLLADDVVLHVPGTHALAGDHRGLDGFAGLLGAMRALTDAGETIEVIDILGGSEHAAVYCHVTATRRRA